MDDTRADRIEERLAHLQRLAEELSDVVTAQAEEIATLQRRLRLLMEREAEREAETASTAPLADRPPPHW